MQVYAPAASRLHVFSAVNTPIFTLVLFATTTSVQTPVRETRPVTLQGCVQSTSDPNLFLLAVLGEFPDAVRGIAKGVPVPEGAGAGPEPRSNPLANPPRDPSREPRLPEGRYTTPTVQNRSFKVQGISPMQLKLLVGRGVEVVGRLPIGGFPSGDAVPAPSPIELNPPLQATSIKQVANSCDALIREKSR
jgi:hypothetical protein